MDSKVEADNKLQYESLNPPPLLFSKRFSVVTQILIGCFHIYALRANMNIAIVEMTSNKTIIIGNETIYQPAEFNWDSQTKGLILSIFGYGYLASVFGGNVSAKFGGSTTFGISIFMVGLITIATPLILYTHFYLFLASRALNGIFECFAYASTADIFVLWTPKKERSRMISYSINGYYIGMAAAYPLCGFIAHRWGWPIIFYATGFLGCATSIIWLISVKNHPSDDKWISKRELNYLLQETDNTIHGETKQPWMSIFKSKCFWALCVTQLSLGTAFSIIVTCFPLYVKDMTSETTDIIGLISSIPTMVGMFTVPASGMLIDYWQNHSNLRITMIHRLIVTIGFLFCSLLLVIVVCTTNFVISMVCFVLIKICMGFNFLVTQLVGLYMAPNHSSTVLGLTTVWYTIGTIFAPTFVGYIVKNHSREEWNESFLTASFILALGALIFAIYGSSEPQKWSISSNQVNKYEEQDLQDQNEKFLEQ